MLRVPAGVRLDRPIVVRWSAGAAGRALLTRTIVELGEGAVASIVEELRAVRRCRRGRGRRRSSPATPEVRLAAGRGARASRASRTSPANTVAFQHRHAAIGEGATLHWALAQLGGAARPEPGRQPPRRRSQLRRAGRDRVRRRGPAVRPDLVHPPRRPRHDRQPPLEGRPARRGPVLHEGPDHDREDRASAPTASSASSG